MLATLGVGAAALIGVERAVAQTTTAAARGDLTPKQLGWDTRPGRYVLPDLPYGYHAREPHIAPRTMRLRTARHPPAP